MIAYKAALDLFDVMKKQQWVTTNYAVLIYAAIYWYTNSNKGRPPPGMVCFLIGCAGAVGLVSIGLLVWFQNDIKKLRERLNKINPQFFSQHEYETLGLQHYDRPFGRGWHVLTALILVCLLGAKW